MATSKDYGLGPETYPRGWFIVASSAALDNTPMALRYFGQDFVLYRGESGKPIMLDAYCKHMGTHLASDTAMIVRNGQQIEGDSIRCPYHGWRYGPDGLVNDIPHHDGPCPKSAAIKSYLVRDVMGCIMMWFDPQGGDPEFEPPMLKEWDDPQWVDLGLKDLGQVAIHNIEILDNMADVAHLGPTHGQPCDYFENEFRDHYLIQRQGGAMQLYNAHLHSTTWYTGIGILLSKQVFGQSCLYQLIAHVPVEDGLSQVWHGTTVRALNSPAKSEDMAMAKQAEKAAMDAFSTDFGIWKNKQPALKIMQHKTDGPFNKVRQWVSQFYTSQESAQAIRQELNGVYGVNHLPQPDGKYQEIEEALFE